MMQKKNLAIISGDRGDGSVCMQENFSGKESSLKNIFVGTKQLFLNIYPEYATHILKTHESLASYEYIVYIKPESTKSPAIKFQTTTKITVTISALFEKLAKEKILIVVGRNLSVTIHDTLPDLHTSIGYWLDESATCTVLYKRDLAQESSEQKSIEQDNVQSVTINCYTGRHSSLTVYFLIANIVVPDLKINCYLLGEYSNIQVDGAFMLQNRQQATVSIYQEHLVSHTSSNVMVKSALRDSAYICYKGLIYIGTNAPYTDAVQNNKNIIVAGNGDSMANNNNVGENNARAHSIPSLEILNNEVRCAHGSAVGPVDKEQLFVLQSRGLDQAQATQVLIDGFIGTHFNGLWPVIK